MQLLLTPVTDVCCDTSRQGVNIRRDGSGTGLQRTRHWAGKHSDAILITPWPPPPPPVRAALPSAVRKRVCKHVPAACAQSALMQVLAANTRAGNAPQSLCADGAMPPSDCRWPAARGLLRQLGEWCHHCHRCQLSCCAAPSWLYAVVCTTGKLAASAHMRSSWHVMFTRPVSRRAWSVPTCSASGACWRKRVSHLMGTRHACSIDCTAMSRVLVLFLPASLHCGVEPW